MSSASAEDRSSSELLFRSVSGCELRLSDKTVKAKNVMKFVLHKDISLNVNVTILVVLATLFLWKAFNILTPFAVSAVTLALQIACFVTSVNRDTLVAVESIGIYTEGRRIFYGSSSCEFVPWDTVVDVFINEVITGQKVLYYLTLVVKDSFGGKDSIKLIPLFRDLIPERKCLEYMYERLSGLIGVSKEKIRS